MRHCSLELLYTLSMDYDTMQLSSTSRLTRRSFCGSTLYSSQITFVSQLGSFQPGFFSKNGEDLTQGWSVGNAQTSILSRRHGSFPAVNHACMHCNSASTDPSFQIFVRIHIALFNFLQRKRLFGCQLHHTFTVNKIQYQKRALACCCSGDNHSSVPRGNSHFSINHVQKPSVPALY